jgi:hypothetical protein
LTRYYGKHAQLAAAVKSDRCWMGVAGYCVAV